MFLSNKISESHLRGQHLCCIPTFLFVCLFFQFQLRAKIQLYFFAM